MTNSQALKLLPLIRPISQSVLAVLLHVPVGPNIITGLSLSFGLAAAATIYQTFEYSAVWAAILLTFSYIFDNCDGEIARRKNLTSTFGRRFDNLSDCLVHASFFVALGHAWQTTTSDPMWSWMGWTAAAGSTINYLLTIVYEHTDPETLAEQQTGNILPQGLYEWFLFGFRELARADFCFLVLVLAVFELHWLLLPATAIGAQVYWLTQFHTAARRFRV